MSIASALLACAAILPASLPVQGIVQDRDGHPVEKALIFYYSEGRWGDRIESAARAISARSGRFRISEPEEPPLFVDSERVLLAFKPGVGIAAALVDSRWIPGQPISLRLRATEPVRIHVLRPDGQPLPDAEIKVTYFGHSD